MTIKVFLLLFNPTVEFRIILEEFIFILYEFQVSRLNFNHSLTSLLGLECLKESKKIIAMVMGAVVMTLIFIVMLSFLFIRDRRRQGYERM